MKLDGKINIQANLNAGVKYYQRHGVMTDPGKYEDHWVCEYWNPDEERFVRVDAQIDDVQQGALEIDFDRLDLPLGMHCWMEQWN